MIDRTELARQLAKAIAFANAGNAKAAYEWAVVLDRELRASIANQTGKQP